jgi:hypothetical protein
MSLLHSGSNSKLSEKLPWNRRQATNWRLGLRFHPDTGLHWNVTEKKRQVFIQSTLFERTIQRICIYEYVQPTSMLYYEKFEKIITFILKCKKVNVCRYESELNYDNFYCIVYLIRPCSNVGREPRASLLCITLCTLCSGCVMNKKCSNSSSSWRERGREQLFSVERHIVWDRSISNGRFCDLNSRWDTIPYVFLKLCYADQHKMVSDFVPIVALEPEVSLFRHPAMLLCYPLNAS